MSLVTKPFTFSSGAIIYASEHNSNFNTIYDEFNGGIGNANIASGAAISDSKLAQITTAGKVSISALTVASQAQGDVIYASASNAWARLAPGTSGQYLKTLGASANPAWADCAGTVLTTQGDVLYRDSSGLARLGVGTSGQFLKTQGSGANPVWANPVGSFTNMQVFSSTGTATWTKPSTTTIAYVKCWGAGGGGSSASSDGGGGGGAYAEGLVTVSGNVTVTVGAGAAVGTGDTGGTSSFGSDIIAVGGVGTTSGAGGAGGASGSCTGTLKISGQNGFTGHTSNSGAGGNGALGGSGGAGGGSGIAGIQPGGGGSGGTGGANVGGHGMVIVYWAQ